MLKLIKIRTGEYALKPKSAVKLPKELLLSLLELNEIQGKAARMLELKIAIRFPKAYDF